MSSSARPPLASTLVAHAELLLASHLRVTGRPLLDVAGSPAARAEALYEAPFVVLSHGTGPDPVFNYGNLSAQRLFELGWDDLLTLPSRQSAEPVNQAERQRLLDAVSARGFIDDYAGVRISSSGRRFRIVGATVWNVVDDEGHLQGQAATFGTWTPL